MSETAEDPPECPRCADIRRVQAESNAALRYLRDVRGLRLSAAQEQKAGPRREGDRA